MVISKKLCLKYGIMVLIMGPRNYMIDRKKHNYDKKIWLTPWLHGTFFHIFFFEKYITKLKKKHKKIRGKTLALDLGRGNPPDATQVVKIPQLTNSASHYCVVCIFSIIPKYRQKSIIKNYRDIVQYEQNWPAFRGKFHAPIWICQFSFSTKFGQLQIWTQFDPLKISTQFDQLKISTQFEQLKISTQFDQLNISTQFNQLNISIQFDQLHMSTRFDQLKISTQFD